MITSNIAQDVLLNPFRSGCDELCILSGGCPELRRI